MTVQLTEVSAWNWMDKNMQGKYPWRGKGQGEWSLEWEKTEIRGIEPDGTLCST